MSSFVKCKKCGQFPTASENICMGKTLEISYECLCGKVGETIDIERYKEVKKESIIKKWNDEQEIDAEAQKTKVYCGDKSCTFNNISSGLCTSNTLDISVLACSRPYPVCLTYNHRDVTKEMEKEQEEN